MNRNVINKIIEEREEQIKKHGFDAAHDDQYFNNELLGAARFALTLDAIYYPTDWDKKWAIKIEGKTEEKRLVVAGAFIVAHLELIERRSDSRKDGVEPPPDGPKMCQKANRIGRAETDTAERISVHLMAEAVRMFQMKGPSAVDTALELRNQAIRISEMSSFSDFHSLPRK